MPSCWRVRCREQQSTVCTDMLASRCMCDQMSRDCLYAWLQVWDVMQVAGDAHTEYTEEDQVGRLEVSGVAGIVGWCALGRRFRACCVSCQGAGPPAKPCLTRGCLPRDTNVPSHRTRTFETG